MGGTGSKKDREEDHMTFELEATVLTSFLFFVFVFHFSFFVFGFVFCFQFFLVIFFFLVIQFFQRLFFQFFSFLFVSVFSFYFLPKYEIGGKTGTKTRVYIHTQNTCGSLKSFMHFLFMYLCRQTTQLFIYLYTQRDVLCVRRLPRQH